MFGGVMTYGSSVLVYAFASLPPHDTEGSPSMTEICYLVMVACQIGT